MTTQEENQTIVSGFKKLSEEKKKKPDSTTLTKQYFNKPKQKKSYMINIVLQSLGTTAESFKLKWCGKMENYLPAFLVGIEHPALPPSLSFLGANVGSYVLQLKPCWNQVMQQTN